MKRIAFKDTSHTFEKQNMVTIEDRRGHHDRLRCTQCGIEAKSYQLGVLAFDGRKSDDQIKNCPKCAKPSFARIQITNCAANGPQFANLQPGTIHEIVEPPEGYKNYDGGVWVMGVGEPVKVLNSEFETMSEGDQS